MRKIFWLISICLIFAFNCNKVGNKEIVLLHSTHGYIDKDCFLKCYEPDLIKVIDEIKITKGIYPNCCKDNYETDEVITIKYLDTINVLINYFRKIPYRDFKQSIISSTNYYDLEQFDQIELLINDLSLILARFQENHKKEKYLYELLEVLFPNLLRVSSKNGYSDFLTERLGISPEILCNTSKYFLIPRYSGDVFLVFL